MQRFEEVIPVLPVRAAIVALSAVGAMAGASIAAGVIGVAASCVCTAAAGVLFARRVVRFDDPIAR
jgi:hypothetical protein